MTKAERKLLIAIAEYLMEQSDRSPDYAAEDLEKAIKAVKRG